MEVFTTVGLQLPLFHFSKHWKNSTNVQQFKKIVTVIARDYQKFSSCKHNHMVTLFRCCIRVQYASEALQIGSFETTRLHLLSASFHVPT